MTINPMVDMASFTAFDLPTDKEDIFWDDSITKGSTDFFDQFVVLDDCNTDWTSGGDFGYSSLGKDSTPQDILPPTSTGPLSVSSTASVDLPCTTTSSSHSHTGPIGTPGAFNQHPHFGGGSTLHVGHEASHPETVEQRHLQFSGRKVPVGGGSISDAELLNLEGLSMRSPIRAARPPIPETFLPPSPPLQSSTTGRPHTTDAKKRSRLESIYATIRKAAHIRTRPRVDQQSVPIPQTVVPANLGSPPKRSHRRLRSENMTATQTRNFPLSPPMSNPMPDLPPHLKAEPGFVSGFVDDPFYEPGSHLGPPAQIHGAMPHTPMDTPQMGMNNRHAIGVAPTSLALESQGIPTTDWPLTSTSMAEVTSMDWPSATYVTASGDDGNWWEGPGSHDIDMSGAHDFQAHARHASVNLNLQLHPYDFHNRGVEDMANGGLMIHMPQPRTPNPAPLLARDIPVPPPPPADHAPPIPSPTRGYHTEHRRPKPRAPSTGARHGLALTSPRKRHTSQSSSSSTSPTPGAGAGRMKRSSSLQPVAPSFGTPSATGAAVRKRKSAASITRGRNYTPHAGGGGFAEPRTPNPQGGSSGGLDIGFVNFTPSDHNILMTGVAPSGSSKTKARREKEAADKQRKMSEAFIKAVKASGADITKLKEEGIVM